MVKDCALMCWGTARAKGGGDSLGGSCVIPSESFTIARGQSCSDYLLCADRKLKAGEGKDLQKISRDTG